MHIYSQLKQAHVSTGAHGERFAPRMTLRVSLVDATDAKAESNSPTERTHGVTRGT